MFKREREKKFVLTGVSYAQALTALESQFPEPVKILTGTSIDTFWTAPGTDFIRLRKNTAELTVKITDGETIEDRVEENLVVDYDTGERWCRAVFGVPVGVAEKTYDVFYLENDVVISLYRVTGLDSVFLEVEGPDMESVTKLSNRLQEVFDMRQEWRSLFQIVFGDSGGRNG